MTNKKARDSRSARAAKEGNSRPKGRGFSLNAHKAAIIVGLISLVGVLAASVIGNWEKLRSTQAPDATGDLLAYNEHRRTLVEGAFDEALGHLQEAEKVTTGQDAVAIKEFAASVREKKAAVKSRYDKVFAAIKDKKPVQAEINKTELNTIILKMQKEYDKFRSTVKGQPADFEVTIPNNVETADLRFAWASVSSSKPAPKYILPDMTFPVGRDRNKPLEFITPAENACTGKPAFPVGS